MLMKKVDQFGEFLQREVIGPDAGIELGQPEVNRVGPIGHRRPGAIPIARWGQKFGSVLFHEVFFNWLFTFGGFSCPSSRILPPFQDFFLISLPRARLHTPGLGAECPYHDKTCYQ